MQLKVEPRTFKVIARLCVIGIVILQTPSNTPFDITVISSNFHIELNPAEAGIHDRIVVQEMIKEISQTAQINKSVQKSFKGNCYLYMLSSLVIVLNEVDRLSRQAQAALRRTMEKYSAVTRLILYCESTSKVIEPIRSRCLMVRIPAPTEPEVSDSKPS